MGEGIIIGVLDTGIKSDHPSFGDDGLPPPPSKWKGSSGIDEAINDGVDVLSISLGADSRPFHNDMIAVGAFSAVKKGIFVSCAGGNSGPANTSLSNEAPWILTVGASTMDRQIKAIVKLGDGRELLGESLFQPPDFPPTMIPLVYPTETGNCDYDGVIQSKVKGKIVACENLGSRYIMGDLVKQEGGAAIVILNQKEEGDTTFAEGHCLPASHVNFVGASNLKEYVNSTDKPVASISFNGTCLGTSPAPVVAFFSSRGPSSQSPGILKPDILGPGVNVLAAWPFDETSTENSTNPTFSVISGTSMSTPHLSGIAALIKAAHPDWSPAAIKSAIMTTADIADNDGNLIMDETRSPANFFATGAGHVNASKAMNPGLVYDIVVDDYVAYLCGLGYEDKNVELITGEKVTCSEVKKITEAQLNYPSIVVSQKLGKLTVNRTATNVEEGQFSTYTINAITANHNVPIEGDVAQRRTYIIRVHPPENLTITRSEDLTNWYKSFLPLATTESADFQFIYTYSEAIIGFAANLTEDEVRHVEQNDNFLKAYPDRLLPLSTTHTPDFLGLQINNGLWRMSNMGKGVIIGMVDTGAIQLLGGRRTESSVDDTTGHGTHAAGTAAGNFVKDVSILGNANYTAAGMAPYAHLAIYQVCDYRVCSGVDILAGMDAAIKDGVDVLYLAFRSNFFSFDADEIAVGAFSATEKGVLVIDPSGNSGPASSTLGTQAPWTLTVGASTMDRNFKSTVKLGNGQVLEGEAFSQPAHFPSTMIPLVYPTSAGADDTDDDDNCNSNNLGKAEVNGKMVACVRNRWSVKTGFKISAAGGAAMLVLNTEEDGYTTLPKSHYLPASHVSYIDGTKIKSGPSAHSQSPGYLKPDIIGPGVTVLAAWPGGFEWSTKDDAYTTFNAVYGTSIAAAHLSGIAALIKAAHPDWSPAAIKSAIMTTSDITDNTGNRIMDETLHPASFFAMGAGHVNPTKASEPGLVYDLVVEDYIAFLCGLGYEDDRVETITHRKVTCSKVKKITEAELNYPSVVADGKLGKLTVNRTATNVEEGHSTYNIKIDMPKGVSVNVSPATLEFSAIKEKKSFTISLSWSPNETTHAEGNFMWVSKKRVVRSPIVIYQKS
uniref:Subtilisin-like protease SBT1.7 n=1 Tax=Ananas comosus var. bracteatus TaxID=296719 RepID=A0A6V7Q8J6_ANACO|nr:unnamed protein product [Ananas comosus var. bracteatus]